MAENQGRRNLSLIEAAKGRSLAEVLIRIHEVGAVLSATDGFGCDALHYLSLWEDEDDRKAAINELERTVTAIAAKAKTTLTATG